MTIAACKHHGPDACCTQCTIVTDGLGFPHPSVAAKRKRLQQCRRCGGWVEPKHWVSMPQRGLFGCVRCVPAPPP